jgi:SAM-dependent methyltransferase
VRPRVDLAKYRQTESEQRRIADILQLVPGGSEVALDVGARDGYLSQLLADRVKSLTALDLETPSVSHPHVACVKGDVTQLSFPDASFDLVVCTEVLEHIRPELLRQACSELMRVASRHLLVGVPYRQDIRVGRTTCGICGGVNPPWGHVNAFDEELLRTLFAGWTVEKTSFVGHNDSSTNRVATLLMDLAATPMGRTVRRSRASIAVRSSAIRRPGRWRTRSCQKSRSGRRMRPHRFIVARLLDSPVAHQGLESARGPASNFSSLT